MNAVQQNSQRSGETLEILAFRLNDQEFCVPTIAIREIRGWGAATPIPHAPADVVGVMNLRGAVIPIIDLALKLGMNSTTPTERSAIVVAEINRVAMGLVVDSVSDILTIDAALLQPVPNMNVPGGTTYSDGIIAHQNSMICFLNLERMFEREGEPGLTA
ncbi:chemotaxis protein CheW [Rhizobium tubonense]|uniref:Chemotaxis protein CheW n=1 Tax=Rhizobium tubonense TaxID=484088 RepID=A0A2W4EWK7_9HYPH|nr:chemotaxis protein CheW [Rhizobium tubonense]PZM14520.1 chemotaxis protein CheW [Rhizobium tubonense]